jgi:hypothetical protein
LGGLDPGLRVLGLHYLSLAHPNDGRARPGQPSNVVPQVDGAYLIRFPLI